MVDLFDVYERDLERALAAMSPSQSRGATAAGLEQVAAEADNILCSMSIEARARPPEQKQGLMMKVHACVCQEFDHCCCPCLHQLTSVLPSSDQQVP